MLSPGRKVLYLLVFFAIPFLLWIIPDTKVHFITFLLIGIFYIVSHYWKIIGFFHQTTEVLFLYLVLVFLTEQFGLQNLFPANTIVHALADFSIFILIILRMQNMI